MAETTINGRTYRVEPILATQAVLLQMRFLKIAGDGIARLPEILQGVGAQSGEAEKASNAALIAALGDIFKNSTPQEMTDLIKDVVKIAHIKRPSGNYEPVVFDGDFTQSPGDLIPVAAFVIREVFGAFLPESWTVAAAGACFRINRKRNRPHCAKSEPVSMGAHTGRTTPVHHARFA